MENLEFCDKHNMVAYLKKPTGSEGFQEILDFLNGSHIRYALTKNPTIYVSLIEKFCQTATVKTVDNGEQEITATVKGKEFTITEASVRRHLQLADVDAEEGEGSGHPSEPQPPPSTTQPTNEEPIPNVVSSSHKKTQVPRQYDTTRINSFMYNIVQESGEIGGRLEANKEDDEEDPEASSKQGRMIEEIDQDAGVTLVTPTHSQEDQPNDQLGVFSATKVLANADKENVHTYTGRRRAVSTGRGGISTASRLFSTADESISTDGASIPVSTAGMVQEVNINIPSPIVIKDKGKDKMEEYKDEQIKRTKLQQEQDRLGHEAVVRLQEELDEEERQRMAKVHEAAQSFTKEELSKS
ncbi:hypothetical protein Tco_0569241 [Tanacetum coccineum]